MTTLGAATGLLLGLITAGQTPTRLTGDEYLDKAVKARAKIVNYDITADVSLTILDKKSKTEISYTKQIRMVGYGSSELVVVKMNDLATGKTIKHYTACRGCVSDNRFHMRAHDAEANTVAASTSTLAQSALFNVRNIGLLMSPLEALSPGSPGGLLTSPAYEPPTVTSSEPNEVVVVGRKQKGTGSQLSIRLNPRLDHNVVEMTFAFPGEQSAGSMKAEYDKPIDGVTFPTWVSVSEETDTHKIAETATFTVRKFNGSVDKSIFRPETLDLRYNSLVQELNPKQGESVVKFFDGKEVVKHPPNPSEYIAGPSPSPGADAAWWRRPITIYTTAAAFSALAAVVICLRSRSATG